MLLYQQLVQYSINRALESYVLFSYPLSSSLLQRYDMQTGNHPNGIGYKMEMHTYIQLLIGSITKTHLYACTATWGMMISSTAKHGEGDLLRSSPVMLLLIVYR